MSERSNALVFRLNDHGQGPELIRQMFLERGWVEFEEDYQEENDWNIWWRTSRFRNCDYEDLVPWQRLNHYPRSTAITKKDSLARNMKRMRGVHGPTIYNFCPNAFNIPNDYTRFVAEYTQLKEKGNEPMYWICKPADLSRGRGIFLFRDLSELQYDCNAVIQRYISDPLLVAGYKFDLRIYVAVMNFHPLTAYIYEEGLVRFSTEKFDLHNLNNMYSHLTNTSINKHSPSYNMDKERVGPGCKWTLSQLRHYFHQSNIDDYILWTKIINIVILTLIIQASQAPKAKYCFELYGFDVMIDDKLKPWLLEVNFSPALSSDCQVDTAVKKPMLHDLIDLLGYEEVDKARGGFGREPFDTLSDVLSTRSSHKSRFPSNSNVSRLPNILDNSNYLMMMSQGRSNGEAEEDAWTDEEIEEEVVRPIIPGCGLPSVQNPALHSNSGRSSASSNRSYASDRTYHSAHSQRTPRHMTLAKKRNDLNYHHSKFGKSLAVKLQPSHAKGSQSVTLEHKISINSDSGISTFSGSSDNSDPGHAEGPVSSRDKNRNHLTPIPGVDSEPDLDSTGQGGQWKPLNSRKGVAAVTKTGFNYSLAGSGPGEKRDSTSTHPAVPLLSLASSLNKDYKRKHHLGFTAKPLMGKSVSIARRAGGLSSGLSHHPNSSRRSSYAKPWRRTRTGAAEPTYVKQEPPKFVPRVGDFVLIFPFNEVTRKCALNSLDARVVIRECQRLLKYRMENSKAAPNTRAARGAGQRRSSLTLSKDACPVPDSALPWPPLKFGQEKLST